MHYFLLWDVQWYYLFCFNYWNLFVPCLQRITILSLIYLISSVSWPIIWFLLSIICFNRIISSSFALIFKVELPLRIVLSSDMLVWFLVNLVYLKGAINRFNIDSSFYDRFVKLALSLESSNSSFWEFILLGELIWNYFISANPCK